MVDHMAKGRFIFGISPGGLPSDAEVFGNLDKDRTAMFVEAIDQILAIWSGAPPYDLAGKFWNDLDRAHADPRARPGHDRQALPAAASADRGDRGGAVLQGRDRGGGARLGPDLGELPAAAVGQDPLAELRGGLRAGRPDAPIPANWRVAKSIFVADDARDRAALRDRSRRPVSFLLPVAVHQAQARRPGQSVQDLSGPAGRRAEPRDHRRAAGDLRHARRGRRADPRVPRARSATSARCSTPATTGWTSSSRGARWS